MHSNLACGQEVIPISELRYLAEALRDWWHLFLVFMFFHYFLPY